MLQIFCVRLENEDWMAPLELSIRFACVAERSTRGQGAGSSQVRAGQPTWTSGRGAASHRQIFSATNICAVNHCTDICVRHSPTKIRHGWYFSPSLFGINLDRQNDPLVFEHVRVLYMAKCFDAHEVQVGSITCRDGVNHPVGPLWQGIHFSTTSCINCFAVKNHHPNVTFQFRYRSFSRCVRASVQPATRISIDQPPWLDRPDQVELNRFVLEKDDPEIP